MITEPRRGIALESVRRSAALAQLLWEQLGEVALFAPDATRMDEINLTADKSMGGLHGSEWSGEAIISIGRRCWFVAIGVNQCQLVHWCIQSTFNFHGR